MLEVDLSVKASHRCDGISRRDALAVGSLGLAGFPLSRLLAAEHAGNGPTPSADSVILVFLGGGLSHHDSFDLKPDAPTEIRGKYNPIATSVPGLVVGELLPRLAKRMDLLTLVRSGAHNNDHHETATNWVLSGRFGSPFGDFPALGAVVAQQKGFRGVVPPYVATPHNPSFTWELGKSAFLGGRYESFKTGDPNATNFRVRDLAPAESVSARSTARRQTLLSAVDDLDRSVRGSDQLASFDEFHRRAADMILAPVSQQAFAMDQEAPNLRDRYGRTTFGQGCLLARRLIERGVRFVTVNFGGWDHHATIWPGLESKLPQFDQGFSALLEDMQSRGLLDRTLVVAMGEFGRTPKINKDVGRDHWGPAASLLFAGAGTKKGFVLGATDKQGAYVTREPVSPADVAYTILEAVGVDPRAQLITPDGRPIEILDAGRTIPSLFV